MYHLVNVFEFLGHNLEFVGDEAPHILIRAYKVAERVGAGGLFPNSDVTEIMGNNLAWETMFHAVADTKKYMVLVVNAFTGGPAVMNTAILLRIVFGDHDIPDEFYPFIIGEKESADEFNELLRRKLKARGVDWNIYIAMAADIN